jgi:hypothetical protein
MKRQIGNPESLDNPEPLDKKFKTSSSDEYAIGLDYSDEIPKIKYLPFTEKLKQTKPNLLNIEKKRQVEKKYNKPTEKSEMVSLYEYLQNDYIDEISNITGLGPLLDIQFAPEPNMLVYKNTRGQLFAINLECDTTNNVCTLTNKKTNETYVIQRGAGKKRKTNKRRKTVRRRKTNRRRVKK